MRVVLDAHAALVHMALQMLYVLMTTNQNNTAKCTQAGEAGVVEAAVSALEHNNPNHLKRGRGGIRQNIIMLK